MMRRPPRSKLTYTLVPDTTLFRSPGAGRGTAQRSAVDRALFHIGLLAVLYDRRHFARACDRMGGAGRDGVPAGHRHRPWDHHYLVPLPDAAAIRPKTADNTHRHDFSGSLSLCRDDTGRELLFIHYLLHLRPA